MDCVFCKLSRKVIPADFLMENQFAFVIKDRNPVAKDHVLVIAHEHVDNLREAQLLESHADRQDYWRNVVGSMLFLATEYGELHMRNGYRIVTNTGPDAGQAVKHVHFHVLGGEKLKDL